MKAPTGQGATTYSRRARYHSSDNNFDFSWPAVPPHQFVIARDRALDRMCDTVRMAAEAGLRGLNYNITLLGHLRTESRYGRGGAKLSSFQIEKLDQSLGEFEGGPVDEDTMWERIEHWL